MASNEQPGLYLPMARLLDIPAWAARLAAQTAFAKSRKDLDDFSQRYRGRADTPVEPVCLYMPDGSITLIPGMGVTEVAELEEIGLAAIERAEAQMEKSGRAVDIDEFRARKGMVARDKVDETWRTAFWETAQEEKKNPIAKPATDHNAELTKGQSQVAVPSVPWHEE